MQCNTWYCHQCQTTRRTRVNTAKKRYKNSGFCQAIRADLVYFQTGLAKTDFAAVRDQVVRSKLNSLTNQDMFAQDSEEEEELLPYQNVQNNSTQDLFSDEDQINQQPENDYNDEVDTLNHTSFVDLNAVIRDEGDERPPTLKIIQKGEHVDINVGENCTAKAMGLMTEMDPKFGLVNDVNQLDEKSTVTFKLDGLENLSNNQKAILHFKFKNKDGTTVVEQEKFENELSRELGDKLKERETKDVKEREIKEVKERNEPKKKKKIRDKRVGFGEEKPLFDFGFQFPPNEHVKRPLSSRVRDQWKRSSAEESFEPCCPCCASHAYDQPSKSVNNRHYISRSELMNKDEPVDGWSDKPDLTALKSLLSPEVLNMLAAVQRNNVLDQISRKQLDRQLDYGLSGQDKTRVSEKVIPTVSAPNIEQPRVVDNREVGQSEQLPTFTSPAIATIGDPTTQSQYYQYMPFPPPGQLPASAYGQMQPASICFPLYQPPSLAWEPQQVNPGNMFLTSPWFSPPYQQPTLPANSVVIQLTNPYQQTPLSTLPSFAQTTVAKVLPQVTQMNPFYQPIYYHTW